VTIYLTVLFAIYLIMYRLPRQTGSRCESVNILCTQYAWGYKIVGLSVYTGLS